VSLMFKDKDKQMKANNVKKVLIALDYDPTAKKVAEKGYEMAIAMDAQITLLHVMVTPEMYASAYSNMGVWQIDTVDIPDGIEILKTGSRNFLEKAKKHLGDKSIQILQKEGDTAQIILETAKEMKADCIVIGSLSQKWLEDILMGSVTKEVLRKTTIPLYIVPTKKQN